MSPNVFHGRSKSRIVAVPWMDQSAAPVCPVFWVETSVMKSERKSWETFRAVMR